MLSLRNTLNYGFDGVETVYKRFELEVPQKIKNELSLTFFSSGGFLAWMPMFGWVTFITIRLGHKLHATKRPWRPCDGTGSALFLVMGYLTVYIP